MKMEQYYTSPAVIIMIDLKTTDFCFKYKILYISISIVVQNILMILLSILIISTNKTPYNYDMAVCDGLKKRVRSI